MIVAKSTRPNVGEVPGSLDALTALPPGSILGNGSASVGEPLDLTWRKSFRDTDTWELYVGRVKVNDEGSGLAPLVVGPSDVDDLYNLARWTVYRVGGMYVINEEPY